MKTKYNKKVYEKICNLIPDINLDETDPILNIVYSLTHSFSSSCCNPRKDNTSNLIDDDLAKVITNEILNIEARER
jgi:hypothetical protein